VIVVLVVSAIIIITAMVCIVVLVVQRRREKFLLGFSDFKDKMHNDVAYQNRLAELESAMDRLFADNKVITSLDDIYLLIHKYTSCRNPEELNHCRTYLKKKYSRGYLRYDKERL